MANNRAINPSTSGTNNSTWMEQVACYPIDVNGDDITKDNTTPTTIYDEDSIPISVDRSTETLQTIEYEHHEIHSGSHFYYCDYALNKSSGALIEFVMTTADTDVLPHLVFEVYASDGATLELYAGASGITGGTSITPRNNRTDSIKVSGVTLIKDPVSITSDGVRAAGYLAGGGREAGFAKRENELVLTRNTTYLVRITSLAVSNDISWYAEWYEHLDKNV